MPADNLPVDAGQLPDSPHDSVPKPLERREAERVITDWEQTARAASEVEAEILTPTEFFDQIASSPPAARELIRRLSQRLREADDRIVNDERRNDRALVNWNNAQDGPPRMCRAMGHGRIFT
jgi:thioesterase domain-containing protein